MKVMETITIPPKPSETKEIVGHVLCDLCGQRGDPEYDQEIDWPEEADNNDHAMTTLMLKKGYSFPEGGHWNLTVFHICPTCFQGKLTAWLESQGAKPTHDESEW